MAFPLTADVCPTLARSDCSCLSIMLELPRNSWRVLWGVNVKYLISIILMLAPLPIAASAPPADVVLEEANRYTVKIPRGSTVGLNEDEGKSIQASGFLVDRTRGWIITNAHVASRSPATRKDQTTDYRISALATP